MNFHWIFLNLRAKIIPVIIASVGHIRVFAAFASIASLVILLHSVFIHPFVWFLLRILTGISLVSIYTVTESWLNDSSLYGSGSTIAFRKRVFVHGLSGFRDPQLLFPDDEQFVWNQF